MKEWTLEEMVFGTVPVAKCYYCFISSSFIYYTNGMLQHDNYNG